MAGTSEPRHTRALRGVVALGMAALIVIGCDGGWIPGITRASPSGSSWDAVADDHRGANGQVFLYVCPPNGTFGTIWGNVVYTDDSSVCTAAVHSGVIGREFGGQVRIVIRPGLASYPSVTRNGVRSEPWPAWEGSFTILGR
jgi:hypothetical protein